MNNNDINLTIESTRQSIINMVNQSGLPIGVVYYMFKDIMTDLSEAYTNYLTKTEREAVKAAQEAAAAKQDIEEDSED